MAGHIKAVIMDESETKVDLGEIAVDVDTEAEKMYRKEVDFWVLPCFAW
jgi:hypothetical protein